MPISKSPVSTPTPSASSSSTSSSKQKKKTTTNNKKVYISQLLLLSVNLILSCCFFQHSEPSAPGVCSTINGRLPSCPLSACVLTPCCGLWHSVCNTQQSCSLSVFPVNTPLCIRLTKGSHLVKGHVMNFNPVSFTVTFLPILSTFYCLQDFWGHRLSYFCLKKMLFYFFFNRKGPFCQMKISMQISILGCIFHVFV